MGKAVVLVVALLLAVACEGAVIQVGSTRTYKTPAAAVSVLKANDVMVVDDGVYASPFDVPPTATNFTIKSASGNPYKCVLDGRGGVGSGYSLSYGKGIIHARAPGLIQGIGFINGGGGDGTSDGEAGLYVENFASMGTLRVVNCSFDANENGIFAPGATGGGPGANVRLEVYNSVFSKNKGNGVNTDGNAHNVYISCAYFLSSGNIWYPSKYGNNLKSRALVTVVKDQWNQHDQGRCLDIPSGGQLTVTGGVYTSVGATAVSNFMCYACENTNSGVSTTPTLTGITIVGARANDAIWNGASGVTVTFQNTVQKWVSSSASLKLVGSVSGVVTTPPSGTTYTQIPTPTLPVWAQ